MEAIFSMEHTPLQPHGKELRRAQVVEAELVEEPIKIPDRKICKLETSTQADENQIRELYNSLPRFGPFYILDDELLMSNLKESTWQHVLKSSQQNTPETIKAYFTAVLKIEKQARVSYPDGTVDDLTRARFIWMMIKDGSFILQLALFALGGSEQLGHPPDHLVFGKQRNADQVRRWIKSLFFVGNQIPMVVLRVLMNQSYFRRVVLTGKWKCPSDLFRRVLFDLLVLPVLQEGSSSLHKKDFAIDLLRALQQKVQGHKTIPYDYLLQKEPSDLLHGLQMLVVGPGGSLADVSTTENMHVPVDIESSSFSYKIHSVTELKQEGIHFKHAKAMGSGGISFKTSMCHAVLTLPTFVVDDMELIFQYLKSYEMSRPLSSNERHVCSYLQFMSELIRTPEDAKLLALSGIIHAHPEQRERLPGILNRLAGGDTNPSLRLVRLEIDNYSRPQWKKIRNFLSLALILTLVQTVYTVLAYYKKS